MTSHDDNGKWVHWLKLFSWMKTESNNWKILNFYLINYEVVKILFKETISDIIQTLHLKIFPVFILTWLALWLQNLVAETKTFLISILPSCIKTTNIDTTSLCHLIWQFRVSSFTMMPNSSTSFSFFLHVSDQTIFLSKFCYTIIPL